METLLKALQNTNTTYRVDFEKAELTVNKSNYDMPKMKTLLKYLKEQNIVPTGEYTKQGLILTFKI